jgi:hypothetical protein
MPWFRAGDRRSSQPQSPAEGLGLETIRAVITDVLLPGHFYTGPDMVLRWHPVVREEVPWEIFHGRLLDSTQTRLRQIFEIWKIYQVLPNGPAPQPVLAIYLDAAAHVLYVTRSLECYAWEGYHAGENVYLSHEVHKWVRELVGSIDAHRFPDVDALRDELICLLFHAVVGASRLPLTSVESPLPAFSLGQLAYCYRARFNREGASTAPMRTAGEMLREAFQEGLAWREQVKLLETVLRTVPVDGVRDAAAGLAERWRAVGKPLEDIPALLRSLFDEVTLSPYTDFVDKVLEFLSWLAAAGWLGADGYIDFVSYLLRHLGRHLTAYDLVHFHHRGANYPDLLLLDAILRRYCDQVDCLFDHFHTAPADEGPDRDRKRIRRRAFRQAWLLRRRYEGHPVPDAPTSPGENARVLPPPFVRIPEEQITDPTRRPKRLFDADPLPSPVVGRPGEIMRQAIMDLWHPAELRELGMALYLDRPLGVFKYPGEPDQTPLLSYEAFSRSIALARLHDLRTVLGLIPNAADFAALEQQLRDLVVIGRGVELERGPSRPGSVSLADAARAAPDFIFLRTTRKSVRDFVSLIDWSGLAERTPLDYLMGTQPVLIMRGPVTGSLQVFDAGLRLRLELRINTRRGYDMRGGSEYPAAGMEAVRAWAESGEALSECTFEPAVVVPPEPV